MRKLPIFFTSSPRAASVRLVLAVALTLPAGAIAAPGIPPLTEPAPTAEPSETRRSAEDSPATDVAALIAGYGLGAVSEPEVEGPFNPVQGDVDYGTIINGFGNERGRPHEGQDMFAPEGTPVISPTTTEVLETGTDSGRGNWAAIYDGSAEQTYVYFHMSEAAEVEAGQRLQPGDPVGLMGCTGSCDGAHLHFEIREGRDPYGTAIDPLPILQRWQQYRSD